jgi:hypothetical protein
LTLYAEEQSNVLLAFDRAKPVLLVKDGESWSFGVIDTTKAERGASEASALEFLNKAAEEKFGQMKSLPEMKELLLEIQERRRIIEETIKRKEFMRFVEESDRLGIDVRTVPLAKLQDRIKQWKGQA